VIQKEVLPGFSGNRPRRRARGGLVVITVELLGTASTSTESLRGTQRSQWPATLAYLGQASILFCSARSSARSVGTGEAFPRRIPDKRTAGRLTISTSKGAVPAQELQRGGPFGGLDACGAIRWMLEQLQAVWLLSTVSVLQSRNSRKNPFFDAKTRRFAKPLRTSLSAMYLAHNSVFEADHVSLRRRVKKSPSKTREGQELVSPEPSAARPPLRKQARDRVRMDVPPKQSGEPHECAECGWNNRHPEEPFLFCE
jgi:hypothetical protein